MPYIVSGGDQEKEIVACDSGERRSSRPRRPVLKYTPGAYFSVDESWSKGAKLPEQMHLTRDRANEHGHRILEQAFTLSVETSSELSGKRIHLGSNSEQHVFLKIGTCQQEDSINSRRV